MRAQGAYKADKHARPTHAHTPTNTPPTHTHTHRKYTSIVIMGLMETEELVSWCFKPSQPQRITSGLMETEERKREISRQKRRGGFSVLT